MSMSAGVLHPMTSFPLFFNHLFFLFHFFSLLFNLINPFIFILKPLKTPKIFSHFDFTYLKIKKSQKNNHFN